LGSQLPQLLQLLRARHRTHRYHITHRCLSQLAHAADRQTQLLLLSSFSFIVHRLLLPVLYRRCMNIVLVLVYMVGLSVYEGVVQPQVIFQTSISAVTPLPDELTET
jgi:hypothetical protein